MQKHLNDAGNCVSQLAAAMPGTGPALPQPTQRPLTSTYTCWSIILEHNSYWEPSEHELVAASPGKGSTSRTEEPLSISNSSAWTLWLPALVTQNTDQRWWYWLNLAIATGTLVHELRHTLMLKNVSLCQVVKLVAGNLSFPDLPVSTEGFHWLSCRQTLVNREDVTRNEIDVSLKAFIKIEQRKNWMWVKVSSAHPYQSPENRRMVNSFCGWKLEVGGGGCARFNIAAKDYV
jgi:hypothetical protein